MNPKMVPRMTSLIGQITLSAILPSIHCHCSSCNDPRKMQVSGRKQPHEDAVGLAKIIGHRTRLQASQSAGRQHERGS